ncbi:MAG: hypothetical protein KKE11_00950, partial [Gammaproteobacteria bacterium]|nr:hypothetical protein [Gammaproteobacteria bacterium]
MTEFTFHEDIELDPLNDLPKNKIKHYIGRLKQELGAEYFTSEMESQFSNDAKKQWPEDLPNFVQSFLHRERRKKEL